MLISPQPAPTPKCLVYGLFKGMGDLLSAAPVIAAQLNSGFVVHLLCFPGKSLSDLIELIDFGPQRSNLHILLAPVESGWAGWKNFFMAVSSLDPELVWISPHAPRAASSWKIPLLLWIVRNLYWPKARLAGASTEACSFLFDLRAPVDRDLPLIERERAAFAMAIGAERTSSTERPRFVSRLSRAKPESPIYDVLIHPGANAQNRSWPFPHYARTVTALPRQLSIAVLGLPADIEEMRRNMPQDREVEYLTGSLETALATLSQARVLLTMDSGNVHFANALGVPVVALFGKSDPRTIIAASSTVFPIYEKKFDCQPCQKTTCSQTEVLCMNTLYPEMVAKFLLQLLASRPEALRAKNVDPVHPAFLDT